MHAAGLAWENTDCPVSRRRRKRHAVRKMKVGPSKSPCRRRLQTAISCCGPNGHGGERYGKRRVIRTRQVWIREMSANSPSIKRRKVFQMAPQPESDDHSGISMAGAYLLAM